MCNNLCVDCMYHEKSFFTHKCLRHYGKEIRDKIDGSITKVERKPNCNIERAPGMFTCGPDGKHFKLKK